MRLNGGRRKALTGKKQIKMKNIAKIKIIIPLVIALLTTPCLVAAHGGHAPLHAAGNGKADTISVDTVHADTLIAEADLPWPENIRKRIDGLLEDRMFQTSTVGMLVYDLTADSAIYRYNEKQLMRPASTLKMIVTVTALDRLGSGHEYKTRLAYTGEVRDSVLHGDIWCKGGFDPAFDEKDLDTFVGDILRLGADTIKGNLCADLSMKDDDLLGEGWCWDDDNPALSPLLISGKNEFLERLAEQLEKAGMTVEGDLLTGSMPRDAKELCVISRPVMTILPRMMKNSDNLYSESLFYKIAASANQSRTATAKTGRKMVNRLISDFGFKPADYYIADGSGLSLYNYVSPELEVAFLKHAYQNEHIYPYLYDSMPVAGVDGTLEKRMKGGYAAKNVHAKTGTVTGVSALAGYCTASNGHVLCFSIINMGIRHASSGRRFQDHVCEALCRP